MLDPVPFFHANNQDPEDRLQRDRAVLERLGAACACHARTAADGGKPMISRGPSVQQITHELMCAALRTALRSIVDPGRDDPRESDSMGDRAITTLYMIMMSHPVDRRGRCRSCRRPGALLGRRWRRCRVYGEANVWLHQPTEFLRSQLARELRLDDPLATCAPLSKLRPSSPPPSSPADSPEVPVHGRAGERPPPAPPWPTTGPDSVQSRQRAGDETQPPMPALTTLVIGGGYALGLLAATTRTRTIATGGVS